MEFWQAQRVPESVSPMLFYRGILSGSLSLTWTVAAYESTYALILRGFMPKIWGRLHVSWGIRPVTAGWKHQVLGQLAGFKGSFPSLLTNFRFSFLPVICTSLWTAFWGRTWLWYSHRILLILVTTLRLFPNLTGCLVSLVLCHGSQEVGTHCMSHSLYKFFHFLFFMLAYIWMFSWKPEIGSEAWGRRGRR